MFNRYFHRATVEKGCDSMYRCCGCNVARMSKWALSSYIMYKRQIRSLMSNTASYMFHYKVFKMSPPDISIHPLQFHQCIGKYYAIGDQLLRSCVLIYIQILFGSLCYRFLLMVAWRNAQMVINQK